MIGFRLNGWWQSRTKRYAVEWSKIRFKKGSSQYFLDYTRWIHI